MILFAYVILPASTRSSSSVLMNLMMSDENNRDIYITIASMPPPKPCSVCCPVPSSTTIRTGKHTQTIALFCCSICLCLYVICLIGLPAGSGECLEHGYVLNSRYQVVYPFPTFQPAFQLKKDQVILLNTSYSLVACGISLCPGKIHTHIISPLYPSVFCARDHNKQEIDYIIELIMSLWSIPVSSFSHTTHLTV